MMDIKTALFFMFAALMIFAALRVITARNPVHAVLYLVLAFFNASGIWMLLHAEFLAIILIVVYVGAVMVLFLFVVMMLDINVARLREGFWQYFWLGAPIALLMVAEMAFVLGGGYFSAESFPANTSPEDPSNTKALARILFTQYLAPFELASIVLLVAVIVAVVLTARKRGDTKAMHSSDQIAVKRNDRLRIVQMSVERDTPTGKGE